MGIIELIYPLDDKTDNGLGLDIFAQVGGSSSKQLRRQQQQQLHQQQKQEQ
jgi:hypothetical protein